VQDDGAVHTGRLVLVPGTRALLEAALRGAQHLADALGVALPEDWPEDYGHKGVLRRSLSGVTAPRGEGWWLYWIVLTEGDAGPTLAGDAGYKGPPTPPTEGDATVEIGYSVVPSLRRRGIATEAARGLVDHAFARGVPRVRAHTLPDHVASIGVLEAVGFTPARSTELGAIGFAVQRPA
jgi:ribosomal-protein-alanine N-acetyltransferase